MNCKTLLKTIFLIFIASLFISLCQVDQTNAVGFTDCSGGYVGITYDDGPTPLTAAYVRKLKQYGVRATFFDIGDNVAVYPNYVRLAIANGNIVGNHTMTHPYLTQLSNLDWQREIDQASLKIKSVIGYSPYLFRPPYADKNSAINQYADSQGMVETLWQGGNDTYDWMDKITAQDIVNVVQRTPAGEVVLMHDGYQKNIEAIPGWVAGLKRRRMCPGELVWSERPMLAWGNTTFSIKAVSW